MNGKELWRATLGTLDSGWFFDPTYQWGHASSPGHPSQRRDSSRPTCRRGRISRPGIWRPGKQLWKTARQDEISTWGTPALVRSCRRAGRARHQRHEDPRLRSANRQASVDAGTELRGDGRDARCRAWPRVRHRAAIRRCSRSMRSGPAPAATSRFPREQTSSDADRLEQFHRRHVHPHASRLRRSSVHDEQQRRAYRVRCAHREACVPRPGREREGRSRRHPSPPMAACIVASEDGRSLCRRGRSRARPRSRRTT